MPNTRVHLDDGEFVAIKVALDRAVRDLSELLASGQVSTSMADDLAVLFQDLVRAREHLDGARMTAWLQPYIDQN